MRTQYFAPALIALATLSACTEHSYKLVNVPYCKVSEGEPRSGFKGDLHWMYRSANGRGTGPLNGMYPTVGLGTSDSVHGEELLLAVVSCPPPPGSIGVTITTVASGAPNPADKLSVAQVPKLCVNQKVLVHKVIAATEDASAKAKGYDGVHVFPDLDLSCATGTVAKTTVEQIEPRPKS